jgi:hypothetical protein
MPVLKLNLKLSVTSASSKMTKARKTSAPRRRAQAPKRAKAPKRPAAPKRAKPTISKRKPTKLAMQKPKTKAGAMDKRYKHKQFTQTNGARDFRTILQKQR